MKQVMKHVNKQSRQTDNACKGKRQAKEENASDEKAKRKPEYKLPSGVATVVILKF